MAEAGLASDTRDTSMNCAEPAYSTSETNSTSAYESPAARSITPAAKPMPR
jgi:hypothetical protein